MIPSRSAVLSKSILVPALAALLVLAVACGNGTSNDAEESNGPAESVTPDNGSAAPADSQDPAGVRLVSPTEGATIQAEPPEDLVVLDVRTPEEFGEGHLAGAVMIDFYEPDFADRLAELDPDVPYLLYCRSGSRSGQTAAILEGLGFADVADVDGGIVAWSADGLPVVTDG